MKFIELLEKYKENQTKLFVNGMPEEETIKDGKRSGGGVITKVEDDFIVFQITNAAEKQEDTTKEKVAIPIRNIVTLSKGQENAATLKV